MLGATEGVLLKMLFQLDEASDEVLRECADRPQYLGASMRAADVTLRLARQIDSVARAQQMLAADRRSSVTLKPR